MALLVPIILVAILIFLALRYRSRDGGLKACLQRVEQSLSVAADTGVAAPLSETDGEALREAPEHLFRLVVHAMGEGDRTARQRALTAIREYREFRGWKA